MLAGLWGTVKSAAIAVAHSFASAGRSMIEGYKTLQDVGIDIEVSDFETAFDSFSDLDTFKSALDSIESDRLIPASFLKPRETLKAGKFEYIISTSYTNPKGETEDVFMTIASDKRLSQDEILESGLTVTCAEMLQVPTEQLEWAITEGYFRE